MKDDDGNVITKPCVYCGRRVVQRWRWYPTMYCDFTCNRRAARESFFKNLFR
ncbi:hypothetical protein JNUCC64_30880 [Streptomyces sp. JNUCC 64]